MNEPIARSTVLVAGQGAGEALHVCPPLSFWGGIDPASGRITDPRHPMHGRSVSGKVVVTECVVGSSSGSSIVLELIASGHAPAALVLSESDCIATLGVVVARAMGYRGFPVILLDRASAGQLSGIVEIDVGGAVYAA